MWLGSLTAALVAILKCALFEILGSTCSTYCDAGTRVFLEEAKHLFFRRDGAARSTSALVKLALRLCGLVRPAFHGVTARLPTWRAICVVACEKKRVTQLNPKSRNGTLGQRDGCLDRCLRCGSDNASMWSRCDKCLLPLQHLKHGLRGGVCVC